MTARKNMVSLNYLLIDCIPSLFKRNNLQSISQSSLLGYTLTLITIAGGEAMHGDKLL